MSSRTSCVVFLGKMCRSPISCPLLARLSSLCLKLYRSVLVKFLWWTAPTSLLGWPPIFTDFVFPWSCFTKLTWCIGTLSSFLFRWVCSKHMAERYKQHYFHSFHSRKNSKAATWLQWPSVPAGHAHFARRTFFSLKVMKAEYTVLFFIDGKFSLGYDTIHHHLGWKFFQFNNMTGFEEIIPFC